MSLIIEKYGNKNFQHRDTLQPLYKEYGANDITIIFDGDNVRLRSVSGRVIFDSLGYDYSDVRVINLGGSEEVFASPVLLKQRLIDLGYPFEGGVDVIVGGIESVGAGQNIAVDNTDPNNPVVSLTGVIDAGEI